MASVFDFGSWKLSDVLSTELAEKMRARADIKAYRDGELIHSRGDTDIGLSIIESGSVRFGVFDRHGEYLEMSRLGPGHCFGEATLFAGIPRAYDASACGDTRIQLVSSVAIKTLLSDEPSLALALLSATTNRLYSVLKFVDDLRQLPLDVLTAKIIHNMAEGNDGGNIIDCNQSDIANALGVSRVSIGKTLGKLQAQHLISLGYGKIEIVDRCALGSWIDARTP